MTIREFARESNWPEVSDACESFISNNFEDAFHLTLSKTNFAQISSLDELTVWK